MDTADVDPHHMESRLVAGRLGGYNLHWAWPAPILPPFRGILHKERADMYNKILVSILVVIAIGSNPDTVSAKIYNDKKVYALVLGSGYSARSLPPEVRNGLQFPYYIGYLVMGKDNYPFEFVSVAEDIFPYDTKMLADFVSNKYFIFDMNLPKKFQHIAWDSEHFDELFWFRLSNYRIWAIPIPSGLDSSKFEPSFSQRCIYDDTIAPPNYCDEMMEWELSKILIPYERPRKN